MASITVVARAHNRISGYVSVRANERVTLECVYNIAGNGAEQNPSSTVEVIIGGHATQPETLQWKDGPALFKIVRGFTSKKAKDIDFEFREVSNARATGTAMSVSLVGEPDEDVVLHG